MAKNDYEYTYLKTRWYIDCALEPAVLEFFHGIHGETRVCVSEEGRRLTVAGDGETTIMGQMNTYLLLPKTWELKCSGDKTGPRMIAYFHT